MSLGTGEEFGFMCKMFLRLRTGKKNNAFSFQQILTQRKQFFILNICINHDSNEDLGIKSRVGVE